ncbi:MAG: hypothetical protein ACLGI5_16585 [Thermoleophilia bacterium]
MATATTKAPARRPARDSAAKPADGATTLEYLQRAIADIDQARTHAGKDMKSTLDGTIDRMKELASDFRRRAEDEAADWQKTIENTTEDMRRELARRAIHAQQSSDALSELSAEIKKRKAELAK